MKAGNRRRNVLRAVAALFIVVGGGAVGWLLGGGNSEAVASEPIEYVPASAPQLDPFTPQADIRGRVTIKASGQFGGSGSNFVCDRELLIKFLSERPDRLRAWARVAAIRPTIKDVARYIRSLRPSTLVTPTRVTNHSYRDGDADAFQAILGVGTAVLVDAQGAIRARCRCGNPLLDPVLSSAERCDGCPRAVKPPESWQLGASYYATHPDPPRARGERPVNRPEGGAMSVRVLDVLPAGYVLEETRTGPDGKPITRTLTVPEPAVKTVRKTRVRTRTKTRTVTVASPPLITPGPTRTVFVPTTVAVPSPPTIVNRTVTVFQTRTVPETITVYTGEG